MNANTIRLMHYQEGKDMENKKLWYAVQEDRTDEWGNGSFDREEAVKMLKKQGYGLIAVIDESGEFGGVCVDEITFEEI